MPNVTAPSPSITANYKCSSSDWYKGIVSGEVSISPATEDWSCEMAIRSAKATETRTFVYPAGKSKMQVPQYGSFNDPPYTIDISCTSKNGKKLKTSLTTLTCRTQINCSTGRTYDKSKGEFCFDNCKKALGPNWACNSTDNLPTTNYCVCGCDPVVWSDCLKNKGVFDYLSCQCSIPTNPAETSEQNKNSKECNAVQKSDCIAKGFIWDATKCSCSSQAAGIGNTENGIVDKGISEGAFSCAYSNTTRSCGGSCPAGSVCRSEAMIIENIPLCQCIKSECDKEYDVTTTQNSYLEINYTNNYTRNCTNTTYLVCLNYRIANKTSVISCGSWMPPNVEQNNTRVQCNWTGWMLNSTRGYLDINYSTNQTRNCTSYTYLNCINYTIAGTNSSVACGPWSTLQTANEANNTKVQCNWTGWMLNSTRGYLDINYSTNQTRNCTSYTYVNCLNYTIAGTNSSVSCGPWSTLQTANQTNNTKVQCNWTGELSVLSSRKLEINSTTNQTRICNYSNVTVCYNNTIVGSRVLVECDAWSAIQISNQTNNTKVQCNWTGWMLNSTRGYLDINYSTNQTRNCTSYTYVNCLNYTIAGTNSSVSCGPWSTLQTANPTNNTKVQCNWTGSMVVSSSSKIEINYTTNQTRNCTYSNLTFCFNNTITGSSMLVECGEWSYGNATNETGGIASDFVVLEVPISESAVGGYNNINVVVKNAGTAILPASSMEISLGGAGHSFDVESILPGKSLTITAKYYCQSASETDVLVAYYGQTAKSKAICTASDGATSPFTSSAMYDPSVYRMLVGLW